jgi:hypothetical protein
MKIKFFIFVNDKHKRPFVNDKDSILNVLVNN